MARFKPRRTLVELLEGINAAGLDEIVKQGKDPHAATASKVFALPEDGVTREQRRFAKMINFSRIYGATAAELEAKIEGRAAQQ